MIQAHIPKVIRSLHKFMAVVEAKASLRVGWSVFGAV